MRRTGVRMLDSNATLGRSLYALSLVLRGSHGFQAGIFSADRQRGRNREDAGLGREKKAACHRPRIFWCIASPFSAYLNDTIVLYERSDIGASRAREAWTLALFSSRLLSSSSSFSSSPSSFMTDRSLVPSRSGSGSKWHIGPFNMTEASRLFRAHAAGSFTRVLAALFSQPRISRRRSDRS